MHKFIIPIIPAASYLIFIYVALGGAHGLAQSTVESWDDFDGLIENTVASRPDIFYPPCNFLFVHEIGLRLFEPDGLYGLTNRAPDRWNFGVPVWRPFVTETNGFFVTDIGGAVVHSNAVVPYDSETRTRTIYGNPPRWIATNAVALAEWYSNRRRERIAMSVSLIPADLWDTFTAARAAALAGTPLPSNDPPPVPPDDTNRVAFARVGMEPGTSSFAFDVYTPCDIPVDIFMRSNLASNACWTYTGRVNTDAPFTVSGFPASGISLYLNLARGDIDSDGDRIPDGVEMLALGTNTGLLDSDWDGLSDYEEFYRFVTDPNWPDTDNDDIPDGWEVINGLNPCNGADAAGDTDDDDLSNIHEFWNGTDPNNPDTDGDHMPDGWEVASLLNPLDRFDAIGDSDGDMLPNSYEYELATDPLVRDSHLLQIIRVDPSLPADPVAGVFPSISDAFDHAYPGAVIELSAGKHTLNPDGMLYFPPFPVLLMADNWGTSRVSVVEYNGELAAFYLDGGQDNRTIVRGLTLRLGGHTGYQIGFWMGDGMLVSTNGASPVFDGVSVELGQSDVNVGFLCRHAARDPVIFNNCVIKGNPKADKPLLGIYAVDSPDLRIQNCTFLNFTPSPYSYAVQFETTPNNNGHAPATIFADIAGCMWDASFSHLDVYPFVRLEQGGGYAVSVFKSAVPSPSKTNSFAVADWHEDFFTTNTAVAFGGHLLSGSFGTGQSSAPLTWYDFEGQPRDAEPDIGADEAAGLRQGDTDSDGVPDAVEVPLHHTDPYDRDTDNDIISDCKEISDGTDPLDSLNYRIAVHGVVSNQTGNPAPVLVSFSVGSGGWNAAEAVSAEADGSYALDMLVDGMTNAPYVYACCDYNSNAVPDALEQIYAKQLSVTGDVCRLDFLLRDFDGDGVPDWEEIGLGTDPANPSNYIVTFQGTVTNTTLFSQLNLVAGYGFQTNGQALLAVSAVDTNGAFAFPAYAGTATNALWLHVFDDIDTNEAINAGEAFVSHLIAMTGSVTHIQVTLSDANNDKDKDDMFDFWEARNGLCWTNAADAALNPDNDRYVNLHEYWIQGNPMGFTTNANYAIIDAIQAVDDRIAGLNPTNSLRIFSLQDHDTTNYVRNPACWAADIDLTCCSPWNSYQDANGGGVNRAGTLISPIHVLFAAHYDQIPTNGHYVLRFVDQQNQVIERSLIAKEKIVDLDGNPSDLTVGLLNADVPGDHISFAKVLPYEFGEYLRDGKYIPVVRLDQEEKATVGDLRTICKKDTIPDYDAFFCSCMIPSFPMRLHFFEDVIIGDSGNPAFIILLNQPVLLTVWTGPGGGWGSSVFWYKESINAAMSRLGGGYILTEIDLAGFKKLKE